jgi:hypothetical protein
MSSTPLATYLQDLRNGRAVGVAETSFYGSLATLLNTVGKTLKPTVRCIINPKSVGAGIPDGGLYTADQLPRTADAATIAAQIPARGVIEVKGTREAVDTTAKSEQVEKYLARYGQVLITNYRDFLLVGRDAAGKPRQLERYQLAPNEAAFWSAPLPQMVAEHETRLTEYLKRVMLSNAPLSDPKDVAWFLASYARDARARVEQTKLPALDSVRTALEGTLGISFQGERGDQFFRSTLVQTLFYGIFSAWVLWSKDHTDPNDRFDWRIAPHYLHVPMIAALFHQVAAPQRLRPLGLIEVLDWTTTALNRIDRPSFFERFEEGMAVQYFYEPFLEAFDPELRRDLGVWYTPPEIVKYQVERVDAALRSELGIADGLADERVVVLDPCCGTGAYLVEVLKRIATTLQEQGNDALLADDLKQAARQRIFGFELLPAPFVVAHLQLGLLLQQLGAPLADESERVGVYLTNALTGWEPTDAEKERFVQQQLSGMPELSQERDLARQVKRDEKILVILGNPPYSGYAGIAIGEERILSDAYRTTKQVAKPQGQGLNDLYIRFFRMAERRIVEQSGSGVICYISNYSWLNGLSFTGMRERYLEVFDSIWIDNLHGDRKISEYAPDGRTSETIFAMGGTSTGIQIGTAISLLVRKPRNQSQTQQSILYYRDFEQARASERRAALLESSKTTSNDENHYITLSPILELGLPYKPTAMTADYAAWPLLPDLFPTSFPGIKTSRDDVVVDIDKERLEKRMRQYFDSGISNEEMRQLAPGAMESTARFNAEQTRKQLQQRGFLPDHIVRYCYRPFDMRWLYWEPETKLLDEKRAEYFPHVFEGNIWIEARQKQSMAQFDRGYVSKVLSDNFGNGLSNYFPLYLKNNRDTLFDFDATSEFRPNLSEQATAYLATVALQEQELFYHSIAVLHAPAYRSENAGALRQDWPRIPLPNTAATLQRSAALGRQVAALLDSEQAVAGVSTGAVRPELRGVGTIVRVGGGQLQPNAGELELTANWGYAGQGGVTMPGKGRVITRDYTADELASLESGASALGLSLSEVQSILGEQTCDIYLNDNAFWQNIPLHVWEYTIGGYQVIKKWLSYRERPLLGRSLTTSEVREVNTIARRIAAILLLTPQLNANYQAIKADTVVWADITKVSS